MRSDGDTGVKVDTLLLFALAALESGGRHLHLTRHRGLSALGGFDLLLHSWVGTRFDWYLAFWRDSAIRHLLLLHSQVLSRRASDAEDALLRHLRGHDVGHDEPEVGDEVVEVHGLLQGAALATTLQRLDGDTRSDGARRLASIRLEHARDDFLETQQEVDHVEERGGDPTGADAFDDAWRPIIVDVLPRLVVQRLLIVNRDHARDEPLLVGEQCRLVQYLRDACVDGELDVFHELDVPAPVYLLVAIADVVDESGERDAV